MFTPLFRAAPARLAPATRAFSTTPRASVARMTILGRLGVAPEEVPLNNEKTLVRYVIGTNYGKGENQKTSWFRVASFVEGKQKEYLMNVPKGSLVYVDADARMEVYTDSEGNKRSNLGLVARNFDVISRSRNEGVDVNDEGLVHEGSA